MILIVRRSNPVVKRVLQITEFKARKPTALAVGVSKVALSFGMILWK